MRHEDAPYHVGLLKAAEQHGASHQAVMEFQVATSKRRPKIRAGRSRIVFYHRKDMAAAKKAFSRVFMALIGQLPDEPWARTPEMKEKFGLSW